MNLRAMPSGALLLLGSPMAVRSKGRFHCLLNFILFSLDRYLVVVEKLVSSDEPESYAVGSFAPGRVTHGGKLKGEVPDEVRSNQDLNGGLADFGGASQQLGRRI